MTIKQKIGTDEILLQLAEESAEMAQAALKLRRAITGMNPTPMSVEECADNLIEEISDVVVCVSALGLYDEALDEINKTATAKYKRWKERLGIAGRKKK